MENTIQQKLEQKFGVDLRKVTQMMSFVYLGIFASVVLASMITFPVSYLEVSFVRAVGLISGFPFLIMSVIIFTLTFAVSFKKPWSLIGVLSWTASVYVLFFQGYHFSAFFQLATLIISTPNAVIFLRSNTAGILAKILAFLVITLLIIQLLVMAIL